MGNKITYLNASELEEDKVLLLVEASIQAYNVFEKENPGECNKAKMHVPHGYEFVDFWTGIDSLFDRRKTVACYGVVFRTKKTFPPSKKNPPPPPPPYTYIFAFRGTDSTKEMLEDCGLAYDKFAPYIEGTHVPPEVEVEAGFHNIYTTDDEESDTASMQHQLFALVDKYQASDKPIGELYTTGHSLGCTLSTFFTLDMALCRPDIKVKSYNYASPRVGNSDFVDFYTKQAPQQKPETRTVRIQNVYDKVPCVPLNIRYEHLPYAYLIAFYKDELRGKFDVVNNHSVHSYQKVLECVFSNKNKNHICREKFQDPATLKEMKSVLPDPFAVCNCWVWLLKP